MATATDGTIDEDVYCLTCGYNLRGLRGDPVRCPECGELNDLGTALIPAEMIRTALRNMETAPTGCVACAIVFATFGINVWIAPWVFGSVTLIALLGWCIGYHRMKRSFDNRPGWRRLLLDFHLVGFPAMLLFMVIGYLLWWIDRHGSVLVNVLLGAWLVALPAVILALRIYSAARARMNVQQRDAAVRIAREQLRRTLHRHRKR